MRARPNNATHVPPTVGFHRQPSRSRRAPVRSGFSLAELLTTLFVLGLLAAAAIPYFRGSDADRLQAAAEVVVADLDGARTLAMTNNSKYQLTFSTAGQSYFLSHTGTNAALHNLPPSPFALPSDPDTRRTTPLAELPTGSVELYAVLVRGPSVTRTTTLEFNPLGNTTSTASTEIWLRTGSPDAKYVAVSVHPTTGLAAIGAMTGTGPSLPSLSSSPPVAPSGS